MKALRSIGRIIFALTFIYFGVTHFIYAESWTSIIPDYLPFPVYWVFLTGFLMIAAAISIIINFKANISGILLAVMLLIFIFTIHLPGKSLIDIVKNLALIGGAIMVSGVAKN